MAQKFWVVGGDGRQRELAGLLAREGRRVEAQGLSGGGCSLQGVCSEDCILLPLPVVCAPGVLNAPLAAEKISLESVLSPLSPGQLIFGGKVGADTQAQAAARGLTIRDYVLREEFSIANALPTAEGAVQLAMEELNTTIQGLRVLVLGFGRVGKLTAQQFSRLGAAVSVSARSYEALAWAAAMGFTPVRLGTEELSAFELVVNTIPAPVLGEDRLAELAPGALVLDLASKPGGVDWAAAERNNIRAIHALALPGRVAPLTAAAAIRDTVLHMLAEL